MKILKRSEELYSETVAHRRYFHQNPEVNLDLENTMKYIEEKLSEMSISSTRCGKGIVVFLGNDTGKTILLRADVDALPMKEESGLEFSSKNDYAHTCGHDLHGAMLLTAAKILKEKEQDLQGRVQLMFQPGEETFMGAKNMIENGLLEPKPDVCLSFHVSSGQMPVGMIMYNDSSTMMNSSDNFTIVVKGKGCHGAFPESGIDPINVAAHILINLQSLLAREVKSDCSNVLTFGKIEAGDAGNIIPEIAKMYGTLRCDNKEQREFILARMKEVCDYTAKAFRAEAEIQMTSGTPPLICDPENTKAFMSYIKELTPNVPTYNGVHAGASDDLAYILSEVPGTYMYLSAGFMDGRECFAQHNPKVVFNEEILKTGPAYYAHLAIRYLEEHK
ncbi:MAG: M20 family metallopeptidase [Bacillota bacterium]|nr:M20 family metallopeptidase [Bacillota bacterium]